MEKKYFELVRLVLTITKMYNFFYGFTVYNKVINDKILQKWYILFGSYTDFGAMGS